MLLVVAAGLDGTPAVLGVWLEMFPALLVFPMVCDLASGRPCPPATGTPGLVEQACGDVVV